MKRLLQSPVGFLDGRSSSLKHWLVDDVALRRHAPLALVSMFLLGREERCGREGVRRGERSKWKEWSGVDSTSTYVVQRGCVDKMQLRR